MQAISGLRTSLGCTDCKANFSSASSLLKHFAEHISNNALKEGSAESESDDARGESILERALRSPASASGSSPAGAHSPSSFSDEGIKKQVCEQPDDSSKVETPESMLYKIAKGNNNNVYGKLDLQQKVENCVHQFTGSSDSNDETPPKAAASSETVGAESEEFNPLKFCVVTLEEGNGNIELNDSNKTPTVPVNGQCDPQQQYKKYVCTYCFKRFGWSTDLKRHILTHTGERPFQCQLCGATFTRNFLLQKHVLKLHKPVANSEQKEDASANLDSNPPTLIIQDINIDSPDSSNLKDPALNLSKRRRQGTSAILADGNKS